MKKIKYSEAAYIFNYKYKHPYEKYACNWFITMNNDNEGIIKCYVKWWVCCLLFIPACIFCFLYCLWDGGIKEFEIPAYLVHSYVYTGLTNEGSETIFGRLKEIYNK